MTIKARFAKYTTEELRVGVKRLEEKTAEFWDMAIQCKAEGDAEMYKVAYDAYLDMLDKLTDAETALAGRA